MIERQYGKVHFSTSPNGATIYIDGQIIINPTTEESIKTPTTISLVEGRRDFLFRIQGYNDIVGNVIVLPNTSVDIHRNFGGKQPITPLYNNLKKLKLDMGFIGEEI